MSDSLNSGVTDVPSLDAADAAPSRTSTTSEQSLRPSGGRHRAEDHPSPSSRELVESLVARNRRRAWTAETHQDAREPLVDRLDRWAENVHDWVSERLQKLLERRLRPTATALVEPLEVAVTTVTRSHDPSRRPARARFDGPLPKRHSMEALKLAIRDTCEQVGVTSTGEPIWYRLSATNMIPVLNIPTRK